MYTAAPAATSSALHGLARVPLSTHDCCCHPNPYYWRASPARSLAATYLSRSVRDREKAGLLGLLLAVCAPIAPGMVYVPGGGPWVPFWWLTCFVLRNAFCACSRVQLDAKLTLQQAWGGDGKRGRGWVGVDEPARQRACACVGRKPVLLLLLLLWPCEGRTRKAAPSCAGAVQIPCGLHACRGHEYGNDAGGTRVRQWAAWVGAGCRSVGSLSLSLCC